MIHGDRCLENVVGSCGAKTRDAIDYQIPLAFLRARTALCALIGATRTARENRGDFLGASALLGRLFPPEFYLPHFTTMEADPSTDAGDVKLCTFCQHWTTRNGETNNEIVVCVMCGC